MKTMDERVMTKGIEIALMLLQ